MTETTVRSPAGLKNILVATDFSPVSAKAIAFAGFLAARFDATLYAVHAAEPINYAVPAQFWKAEHEAEIRAAGELGKTLRRLFPGVKSAVVEGEGPVSQAVNDIVAARDINLLVLSTHGRSGVPKFLLGSVAEEILRRAPCPVLTIGPHARDWDEVPLERGEILYASDFSPEAYAAAPHAFAWAGEWNARLTLLHALVDGAALNFSRPVEPADAARHLLERQLPEDAKSRFAYQVRVERDSAAADKIVETAERLPAALIVTGARMPKGFPGAAEHLSTSTLHKVIAHAPCAVLSAR